MSFKELAAKPDFPKIEEKILQFWKEKNILDKYLRRNEKSVAKFSFLDGPITANNPMGVHHAWGRTLKDLYQRFKNMQGFRQRFQNGFDNQGLWVEVEVEKKLGFKSKKDIEHYGIDKFVERCKEHTLHFSRVQAEQSKRLGYFMDWGNDYYTLSDNNNYAIWHFLKKCQMAGWIYKGEDVVPWCPRCGTAISQHETLTGDYVDLTHKAVFLKYPICNQQSAVGNKQYLLVWTTTPWTLLANVAIAVNPKTIYSKIRTKKGEVLILAKNRTGIIGQDYEVLEELEGERLLGLRYSGPFDDLPIVEKSLKEHLVVAWEEGVSEEEGTGLVHISTGSGPEDYDLGKKTNLPVFPVLNEEGVYIKGYADYEGKRAQEVAESVFSDLEKKGFLYKTEDYTHRYPVCWRCKTELLFRLVDEWYISMDRLRYQMMEVAKKIRWIPDFGLKLELDWLKNMEDWLVSKKRYWGLCLPIWECECGHFEVIGSKEELREKAIEGWSDFEGHSPHRPWVDKVKIKCPQCQKIISRIPDVGNPWLDAGIVSFSTLKYFEDKDYWQEWFPADLVLECFPGQFKNWFYSLIAMATVLEEKNPFKTLLGHALVRDERGREMHKSSGNVIEFNEGAEKMGADVMRWMYCRQNSTVNLNFGFGPAQEIRRDFLLILWNCYRFFLDYVGTEFKEGLPQDCRKKESANFLDKWILSRINRLLKLVTERLEDYDHSVAARAIEDFVVNDLSTWYIRRSRDRIGPKIQNREDKMFCYYTLCRVLFVLNKIIAPFLPFLAEELWQSLIAQESVHLFDWPKVYNEFVDDRLEKEMTFVRRICSLGHSLRKEQNIKTRQPLAELRVKGYKGELNSDLVSLIGEELNIKKVSFSNEIEEKEGWAVKSQEDLTIALDLRIRPELKEEGMVREVIRQIQKMRKEASYKPVHKILIYCQADSGLERLIKENRSLICQETIAQDLEVGAKKDFDAEGKLSFEGKDLWLAIKKV